KTPSLFDRAVGNNGTGGGDAPAETPGAATNPETAGQKAAEIASKLQTPAGAEAAELKGAVTAAADADAKNKNNGDDKKKTAKDIFNNLNKTRAMGDKKSDGGSGGSSSGGQSQPGQTAQPMAPTNNYSANSAGATSSQPAAQSQNIIAVPVQVDASTFLKSNAGAAPDAGMVHLPSTEIQSKAKERANKYLFEAQSDLDGASDKLEELKEIQAQQKKADEDAKDHKDVQ
ncbi:hypothetical protein HY312_02845, partial [Candidatus Saccharibacteria bacterium]|nr:hypothetical protein [Candidatus Saccharibacteria bacterium]